MVAYDQSCPSSINHWPKILSRREAATYLGISARTFDRLQKDAAIPFVIVGKRKKHLLRDLEIYLMSQRSV